MLDDLTRFADAFRRTYHAAIAGVGSRLQRGSVLWEQFEQALEHARASGDGLYARSLSEKANELAVAKILLDDPHITGPIQYEPEFLPSNRRIDFVAIRELDRLFVEVKSVHPQANDSEATWQRFLDLQRHHPANVRVALERDGLGGQIYGNLLASRSKFLSYAIEFESRLREAKQVSGGPGVLVFCGTGFAWRLSDLQDFADFYRFGTHREDDPFRIMEEHSMAHQGQVLLRNIDHFSCLRRAVERVSPTSFHFSVRGPRYVL